MKKNFKWLINVATLVLCVCALAIGVYAAKQASLTATGTIGFKAHGLDLSITGEMYGHATTKDGQAVTSADPTALTSTFTDGTGTMTLGNMYFSDLGTEVEDIVITLTIQNNTLYAVEGVLSLPTTFNTISFEKTNNPIVQIGASSTATMTIVMELTDTQTEITDTENNFSFTINFTKLQTIKQDTTKNYYYTTMGSAVLNKNQVTEVRWLPFAEKQEDNTWAAFDYTTKPTAGNEYYFISEYVLDASSNLSGLSYCNNYNTQSKVHNIYTNLDAHNYVSSNLRQFLMSTEESIVDNPVYSAYDTSTEKYLPSGDNINLLTQYSIEDSYTYSQITARNVLDELYETTKNADTKEEMLAYTNLVTEDTADKLWAINQTELSYLIKCTANMWNNYPVATTTRFRDVEAISDYWLRLPFSSASNNAFKIYIDGDFAASSIEGNCGARPAFQLTI